MHDKLVAELVGIGMTRNEALAYLTLLEDDGGEGLTGYEVAARSSIPRSAVYGVLRRLEESGAAFSHGSEPARYVATSPKRLLAGKRRDALARLARLDEALSRLPPRARPEPIWILGRYAEVIARIDAMLRGATRSVHLSLWPREIDALRDAFAAVAGRELHRVLHCPAPLAAPPPGFSVWAAPEARPGWPHRAIVVVDGDEALIGGTEPEADNQAVWTTNPSLVDVAANHVVLDITLLARASGRDCSADVGPMMRLALPGEGGDQPSSSAVQ